MARRALMYLIRSVRGRLILLVAALVVPVAALAAALILQAYQNERRVMGLTLISTARAVSGVVDAKIDESDGILRTLTTLDTLGRDDLAGFEQRARRPLAGTGCWFVLLEPSGVQRINTRIPSGNALPVTEISPDLLNAMLRGDTHLSDLRLSGVSGRHAVSISRPYFRGGALKYILTVAVPPAELSRAVDVDRYAPGKIVTIIDRRGTIVARSRSPERFVGQLAPPDMVELTAGVVEGISDSVTLEGIPVLNAFGRSRYGWTTVIGTPKSDLYVSARRLLVWGAVGAGLSMLVAIGMAAWIARALVQNMDALTADADLLARGERPGPLATDLDETDFVATAMRRAAETLLHRTRTLEVLNRVTAGLVAERDLTKIVCGVVDSGRELTGAHTAAFYYRAHDRETDGFRLFTVSPPREAVQTSATPAPLPPQAFEIMGVRRITDALADPADQAIAHIFDPGCSGKPSRSCLIVPLKSRTGEVIGWLFFGHPSPGVFTDEVEGIVVGLGAEAAIAIDNVKLYHALALELEAKSKAEAELREAQNRLSDHARDLERMVDERTASLRDAVTQMEEFSYTVSHDLRAPLRSMHAFAEALLEDYGPKLDDTARDYLHRISRASLRMDELTTDLLSYSRVVRTNVKLEPTEIEPLVKVAIEQHRQLQRPSADLRLVTPLAPVLAHGPSLAQCLANLLTNAAKFVKPGTRPRITVRTESRGDRVKIWVEDEGIGVPPEHHAGLFRIFERMPNATRYEGTGIGLAIVRKAVEKMGGTCGVESDGKTGSQFWIELRAAPRTADGANRPSLAAAPSRG